MNKNTCPAFFLHATVGPDGSYSSCSALGGAIYKFPDSSLSDIWLGEQLAQDRADTIAGKKLPMCYRCWNEEEVGLQSAREYALEALGDRSIYDFTSGPDHLNIKVSNMCNLRCRTCQGTDSYLYYIEGRKIEKEFGLTNTQYNITDKKVEFSDSQLDELYDFSSNVSTIELYGGEPFLDNQIPKYLDRLIAAGRTEIKFAVSTNLSIPLTDQWRNILLGFEESVINVSVDGIGSEFEYLRYPANWCKTDLVLEELLELDRMNNVHVQPVITVSALNIFNVPETYEWLIAQGTKPFFILAQKPFYYSAKVLPDSIKQIVADKLSDDIYQPLVEYMMQESTNAVGNEQAGWDDFKFWTNAKDKYRKQSFIETFDEFGKILIKHNKW